MPCTACNRTMQGLGWDGKQGIRFFWCPFCGTIKREETGALSQMRETWDVPTSIVSLQAAIHQTSVDVAGLALRGLAGWFAELCSVIASKPKLERQTFNLMENQDHGPAKVQQGNPSGQVGGGSEAEEARTGEEAT